MEQKEVSALYDFDAYLARIESAIIACEGFMQRNKENEHVATCALVVQDELGEMRIALRRAYAIVQSEWEDVSHG